MRAGQAVWIPVGFTALYFVVALLVGPSLDDGALIPGTVVTFFIAGVFAAILWVLYGFVHWRAGFPVTKVLILTGILAPIALPVAIVAPLWVIGHLLNP